MKNTIAKRIFDFLKDFPPFDFLSRNQLSILSKKIKKFISKKRYHFYSMKEVVRKILSQKKKFKFKKPLRNQYGRRLL